MTSLALLERVYICICPSKKGKEILCKFGGNIKQLSYSSWPKIATNYMTNTWQNLGCNRSPCSQNMAKSQALVPRTQLSHVHTSGPFLCNRVSCNRVSCSKANYIIFFIYTLSNYIC